MNNKQLAEALQVSPATVSKVLNNCFGVDGKTRLAILREAKARGLLDNTAPADVFCLLPDVPTYFWRAALSGLKKPLDKNGAGVSINIYSRLGDDGIVEEYLRQAKAADCRVLIAAVPPSSAVVQMLKDLARERQVILLTEHITIPDAVYIGEDATASGRQLATACRDILQSHPRVLLLQGFGENAAKRRQGFCEALPPAASVTATVPIQRMTASLPAQLARELCGHVGAFDTVYCTDGVMPQVALALEKLKIADSVFCIGHERADGGKRYYESGAVGAYVAQDPAAQGLLAMQTALDYLQTGHYPQNKHLFVPSSTTIHPRWQGIKTQK